MILDLAVIRNFDDGHVPGDEAFRAWVEAALTGATTPRSLAIKLVDEAESRRLNRRYRERDRPTTVLSFAQELPGELVPQLDIVPLGDLVICAPLVTLEAQTQGKPLKDHWGHLTIHGVLHLLGHNHEVEADARVMENLERAILCRFGIPDPY